MGDEGLSWRDGSESSTLGITEKWERILADTGFSVYTDDDLSIFPPRNHEGIYHHDLQQRLLLSEVGNCNDKAERLESPSSACSSTLSSNFWYFSSREESSGSFVRRVVGSGLELFYSKIAPVWREWIGKTGGSGGGRRGREGFWMALVVMTLALLYTRYAHRRDKLRLLLLLREKDQKIGELLHRIAQLNEILSSQHKVPVLQHTQSYTEASRDGFYMVVYLSASLILLSLFRPFNQQVPKENFGNESGVPVSRFPLC